MSEVSDRLVIGSFEAEFARYRVMSERAAEQVAWEDLRVALSPETNSVAVMMKHVAGNLRSRWTEPFTTDGEKPWRDRDAEFVDDFADRAALDAWWRAGWAVVEAALRDMADADLGRIVRVRGEAQSLALALARSATHTAYHAGQIVQLARHMASRRGVAWKTLTIPRGGSAEFNRAMGYGAGREGPGLGRA